MRIAITGSEGMLGNALKKVFSDSELICFRYDTLDISVLDKVMAEIRNSKPEILIHAAAYTNVDLCESNQEEAFRVNGIGTRNLAMACEEVQCPILYISTDYVFDGTKGSDYNEWDITNPINIYGQSKLLGESYVSGLTNRFYIVRTSWLYGSNGNNFVDTILKLLNDDKPLRVVNDQFGSPTFTSDLANKLREIIGKGYGIYHITNSGICSWYEFAVKIASIKNVKKEIIPVSSADFIRPAKRPSYSGLNNSMLKLQDIKQLRNWEEALDDYLFPNL